MDERGVYIYYTVQQACEQLGCKRDKAMSTFKALEEAGLITQRRVGYSNPYRIYVTDLLRPDDGKNRPMESEPTDTDGNNRPIEVGESGTLSVGESAALNVGKIEPSNIESNQNNLNNIDSNDTQSSSAPDWMTISNQIKWNINYEALYRELPVQTLDSIVRVILITYCSTQSQIKIAHSLIPIETVRTELLSLNESHIRYVAEKLQHVGSNVSNMVGYIRTMLWNARTEAEITGQPSWSSSSWGDLPAWYLRDDDHILTGEEGGAW